jgi:solute carrier family 32 (vesicular inhibitory amino acid transporter)
VHPDEGIEDVIEEDHESFLPEDGMVDQFEWDDMLPGSSAQEEALPGRAPYLPRPTLPSSRVYGEDTPLLRKAMSFSDAAHPRLLSGIDKTATRQNLDTAISEQTTYQSIGLVKPALSRRTSAGSTKIIRHSYGGKSTYGQTVTDFSLFAGNELLTFLADSYSIQ